MAKKNWTDEERKAFGAKMQAARKAKKAAQVEEVDKEEIQEVTQPLDKDALILQLLEQQNRILAEKDSGGAKISNSGVQGVVTKYPLDPKGYQDPTERLYDIPELARFALRQNYVLTWAVEMVEYDSHNIHYREPVFKVTLERYPTEAERAEAAEANRPLSDGALIHVQTNIMHEDETAAHQAATRLGIDYERDFGSVEEMLEAMRFERFKQWLIHLFIKPITPQKRTTEFAIGGRVVKVRETEQIL